MGWANNYISYIAANPTTKWANTVGLNVDINDPSNVIYLNFASNYVPPANQSLSVAKQFSIELSNALAPSLQLQETYNCNNATYTSEDITHYGAPAGYTITNISRTHIVTPPVAAIAAGQTQVSSSAATVVLGAPNNQLWTGTYAASLDVDITYTNGNHTTVVHVEVAGIEQKVECDTAYCKLQCCLNDIIAKYNQYKGANTVLAQDYFRKWQVGTQYFFAIVHAEQCNNAVAAQKYRDLFYLETGCDANCSCDCNDTPGPVIPTVITNGTNGTNGLSFLQGSGVPANGLGNVGDSYLDYSSSNGQIYKKTAPSTWTATIAIKGATGATGATGAAGANGSDGTTLFYSVYVTETTLTDGVYETLQSGTTDHTDPAKTLVNVGDTIAYTTVYERSDPNDTNQIGLKLLFDSYQLGGNQGFYNNDARAVYTVKMVLTDNTSGNMTVRVLTRVEYFTEFGSGYKQSSVFEEDVQDITGLDFSANDYLFNAQAQSYVVGDVINLGAQAAKYAYQ
jgi:hypothetical protein